MRSTIAGLYLKRSERRATGADSPCRKILGGKSLYRYTSTAAIGSDSAMTISRGYITVGVPATMILDPVAIAPSRGGEPRDAAVAE